MHYRHAEDGDYRAVASGAVLSSAPGLPAFPARLAIELLGRARAHRDDPGPVTLWDPCCGAGQLVATLGLLRRGWLRAVVASDADPAPLAPARRNLALLDPAGLAARRAQLEALAREHGRASHAAAAADAGRLGETLVGDGGALPAAVRLLDVLDEDAARALVAEHRPGVVLVDAPHERLTHWRGSPADLLPALARVLDPGAVVAVAVRGRRAPVPDGTRVLERLRSGHRAVVIVRAGDVAAGGRNG